jgi:phosphoribosyl-AMP cyclohydrolase
VIDTDDVFSSLRYDADGLVPAVIQDSDTDAVLMVGFMNAEAVRLTRETGRTHFWSRSRGKLWRKGETSGHEQFVQDMYVNCELNTLLVTVTQIGAVCHDGYPTCFYRRIDDDGRLTVVRDRSFDPSTVYGSTDTSPGALVRLWYGAYEYLRDHDLSAESSTSRRLQPGAPPSENRLAEELRELAGVLDGTHCHGTMGDDVVLESSQVLYWVALAAVRDGISSERLQPEKALIAEEVDAPPKTVAGLLRRDADRWESGSIGDRTAQFHATTALVAQACTGSGVRPIEPIERDVAELKTRPYLQPYFAARRP